MIRSLTKKLRKKIIPNKTKEKIDIVNIYVMTERKKTNI
jgi:hypothetical protein